MSSATPGAACYANARRIMYWTCAAIPVALTLLFLLDDGGSAHYLEKTFRLVTWAMTVSVSFIVYGGWLDFEALPAKRGE